MTKIYCGTCGSEITEFQVRDMQDADKKEVDKHKDDLWEAVRFAIWATHPFACGGTEFDKMTDAVMMVMKERKEQSGESMEAAAVAIGNVVTRSSGRKGCKPKGVWLEAAQAAFNVFNGAK